MVVHALLKRPTFVTREFEGNNNNNKKIGRTYHVRFTCTH